jgi:hypothetical protein
MKGEEVDLEEVAYRLGELTQVINDMMNDHYTDYLEYYAERCWQLEEEITKLKKGGSKS